MPVHPDTADTGPVGSGEPASVRRWWVYALGFAVVVLVVVVLHLAGVIGPGSH